MPKLPLPGTTTAACARVDLGERRRDVAHDALERLRHVVEARGRRRRPNTRAVPGDRRRGEVLAYPAPARGGGVAADGELSTAGEGGPERCLLAGPRSVRKPDPRRRAGKPGGSLDRGRPRRSRAAGCAACSLAGVAVAEVAQEVRLDLAVRRRTPRRPWRVESAHRPAVEPERARGEDQVGALQRPAAERVGCGCARRTCRRTSSRASVCGNSRGSFS